MPRALPYPITRPFIHSYIHSSSVLFRSDDQSKFSSSYFPILHVQHSTKECMGKPLAVPSKQVRAAARLFFCARNQYSRSIFAPTLFRPIFPKSPGAEDGGIGLAALADLSVVATQTTGGLWLTAAVRDVVIQDAAPDAPQGIVRLGPHCQGGKRVGGGVGQGRG